MCQHPASSHHHHYAINVDGKRNRNAGVKPQKSFTVFNAPTAIHIHPRLKCWNDVRRLRRRSHKCHICSTCSDFFYYKIRNAKRIEWRDEKKIETFIHTRTHTHTHIWYKELIFSLQRRWMNSFTLIQKLICSRNPICIGGASCFLLPLQARKEISFHFNT